MDSRLPAVSAAPDVPAYETHPQVFGAPALVAVHLVFGLLRAESALFTPRVFRAMYFFF